MSVETVIREGLIATVEATFRADIGIDQGRICAIAEHVQGREVIDATGCVVVPGAIDVHTHFETGLGDSVTADDYESGSRAAAFGGITTYVNYAFQDEGKSLGQALDREAAKAAPKSYVDDSFRLVVTRVDADVLAEFEAVRDAGFSSVKLFTAVPGFQLGGDDVLAVVGRAANTGMLVNVHAEDGALVEHLTARLVGEGRFEMDALPEALRPGRGARNREARDLRRAAGLPDLLRPSVVGLCARGGAGGRVAPSSTSRRGRSTSSTTTGSTTCPGTRRASTSPGRPCAGRPTARRCGQPWRAARPRPARPTTRPGCSRRKPTRRSASRASPAASPTSRRILGMLYSEGVRRGRLSLSQLVAVTSTNPAKLFGMWPRKGTIAVGADADFAIIDPEHRLRITSERMQSRSDFDPYEGLEAVGWPVKTVVRGRVVVDRGRLAAAQGSGELIWRGAYNRP